MKTKVGVIVLFAIILLSLIGCKQEVPVEEPIVETPVVEEPIVEEPIEPPEEVIEVKEGIPSPISGIYAKEELVNRRVVGVIWELLDGF